MDPKYHTDHWSLGANVFSRVLPRDAYSELCLSEMEEQVCARDPGPFSSSLASSRESKTRKTPQFKNRCIHLYIKYILARGGQVQNQEKDSQSLYVDKRWPWSQHLLEDAGPPGSASPDGQVNDPPFESPNTEQAGPVPDRDPLVRVLRKVCQATVASANFWAAGSSGVPAPPAHPSISAPRVMSEEAGAPQVTGLAKVG